jgi:hypothetical protein
MHYQFKKKKLHSKKYRILPKYNTKICDDKMSFQECELAILRHAVDETEKLQGEKKANSEDVRKIIKIVEDFILYKKLICYGGTAINNILPKYAQFYNKDLEIPDYDFFSPNALDDAKELADIYYNKGYTDVEAKSGVHMGTFKVFVNFIPVADVTFLPRSLFLAIGRESISIAGIRYAPPNYLRMGMYLELSRPAGDVSRWEKVLKRLTLLNQHYPLSKVDCHAVDFQRKMDDNQENSTKIYFTVRDAFIEQGVIFFGGYASSLYSKYMPENQKKLIEKVPDFDVLAEDPERCALIVLEKLAEKGIKHTKQIVHPPIGEIIPRHIEIMIGKDTVAFIYQPIACHNYNTIQIDNKEINVATIDTMLSFYLAFIFTDKFSYFKDRILCMAKFLFEVEEKNRLQQKGLLKRFSIQCYGKQPILEDIRAEKAEKFKELANKKNTPEYEMWFLKYSPKNKKGEKGEPIEKGEKGEPKKEGSPFSKKNSTLKSKSKFIKPKPKRKNKTKRRKINALFNYF